MNRVKAISFLSFTALSLISLCSAQIDGPIYPELWEQVAYEGNVLNDKSFAYY